MRLLLPILLLLLAASPALHAGADEDWAVIEAMDKGPARQPTSREDARALARAHFARHRKLVEAFLIAYPGDPRTFDGRLRLAALLAAEGNMDNISAKIDEAMRLLSDLEKLESAPKDKRADAGFRRVSLYMQVQKGSTDRMRDAIVASARGYAARYPGDKRGPRLLVEAATICDESPRLKKDLLDEAMALTAEEALKARINDDYKRLNRLGQPLELKLSTLDGGTLDLKKLRGRTVMLIFWSADSPHCLLWLQSFRAAWDKLPKEGLSVVMVSLDEDRKLLEEKLAALGTRWPTHFDGKGWYGEVPRSLGINSLPTIWMIDKKGVLRALNARDNYETWIRKLQRE